MFNAVCPKILIALWMIFAFSFKAEAGITPKEKRIIIVFRYDDYSSVSPTTIEEKVINAFQAHGIPCIFGVIPYACIGNQEDRRPQDTLSLTRAKAEILKGAIKNGILEVALHGYSHQTKRRDNHLSYTEFFGSDYNIQMQSILKGKRFLEETLGVPITTFIPPWNSYDRNTTQILEKLKFKIISAGPTGYANKISPLKFLPATCPINMLRNKIELARRIPDNQPVIVILIHAYNFLEADKYRGRLSFQEFEKILDWVASQKDVCTLSLNQAIKITGGLNAARFVNYSFYYEVLSLIPRPLWRYLPAELLSLKGIYISQSAINNLKVKLWIFLLLPYLAILTASAAISFLVGRLLLSLWPLLIARIYKFIVLIGLILTSIYVLHNLVVTWSGLVAIVTLGGAYIGASLCLYTSNKHR